jgi:hypothetical protein
MLWLGQRWLLFALLGFALARCAAGGDGEPVDTSDTPASSSDTAGLETDSETETDTGADGDADADSDADTDVECTGETCLTPTDTDSDPDTQTDLSTDTDSDTLAAEKCVNNTRDEAECSNCCRCLQAECQVKLSCMESCVGHLYQNNDDFIDLEMPTELGPDGNYLGCTLRGETPACKECCRCDANLLCGDMLHCEAACDELSK